MNNQEEVKEPESIHGIAKRLWQQGYTKENARLVLRKKFAYLLQTDKKRTTNLIQTYTRQFFKKGLKQQQDMQA